MLETRKSRCSRAPHASFARRLLLRRLAGVTAAGALVAMAASVAPSVSAGAAASQAPTCSGTPLQVTAACVDPLYSQPVIDSQTDITNPVPVHKVSGHFEVGDDSCTPVTSATCKRFNIYLPPKSEWDGRFFQSVYPLQDENACDDPAGSGASTAGSMAFGAASGAYTVQTNGGSGYRVDAAAAKYSKTVAATYYGSSRRIYGYVYGASGGSFQTISATENTTGVWDGAVPIVIGTPVSIPNFFFVRAFARFVLVDKAPQIADAVAPGGSGDPYAGLSEVQRAVLLEATKLGVPLRAWEDYSYALGLDDPGGLLGFGTTVRSIDSTYASDFWTKPGYLGTEQSALGDLFRAARIHTAIVTQVSRDPQNVPTSLVLDDVPPVSSPAGLADHTLYAPDGTTVIGTLSGSLDATTKVFTIGSGNPANVLDAITSGAKLRIDNSWPLALLVYHRYQVPTDPSFHAWDQLRNPDGTPIYPQRFLQIGPLISNSVTGGGTFTGKINGKVIVVDNLLDTDAFVWPGDWYAQRVKAALGAGFDNSFRLYFNDNADHIGAHFPNLVDYDGIIEQALRDVSVWAERCVAPPPSTRYSTSDSQVSVPAKAAVRRGIQPVVDLTVRHGTRIDVTAGQPVTFKAKIKVPPNTGKIVATDWDFTGDGTFIASPFGAPKPTVQVHATHTYTTPGTYFAALRATSQRNGVPSPFAQVQNLGRVRIVVH